MSTKSELEEKGFAVTPARVAFILSLIGLVTFGWKIAAHATSNDMTLEGCRPNGRNWTCTAPR